MKKVLLVTYYFPPVNAVAGIRAWSWAVNFIKSDIRTTVITRHWKGNESKWSDLTVDVDGPIVNESNDYFEVYRLPSRKLKAVSLLRNNLLRINFFSKLFYLVLNSLGFLNVETDARSSFKKFLFKHLEVHHYDLIIVTSPPLNLIRLAYNLNRYFKIPVHVDFRDLWNNGYLNINYNPPMNLKWIDRFKRVYIKRWLKNVSSVSAVSKPIAEIINHIYSNEIIVVTNGFDETHYTGTSKKTDSRFRFSLVGTYYAQQSFKILIEGLKRFLADKHSGEFVINLIGVSVDDKVFAHLVKSLPNEFLHIKDRLSTEEAADYIINSEVLFQSAWKGYRGIYTTKLFDFIASGNNILLAPGDDDVMDDLIVRTRTGKIANSVEEFVDVMNSWFHEWRTTGTISYKGDNNEISKYSRQNIANDFAKKINELY